MPSPPGVSPQLDEIFKSDILTNMDNESQPSRTLELAEFFSAPSSKRQRRYEILRAFYFEGLPAKVVASRFGCSPGAVYSIARDFRNLTDPGAYFFHSPAPAGRPRKVPADDLRQQVIDLRKLNLSVADIKARLDTQSPRTLSERAISRILKEEGFPRLARRTKAERSRIAHSPSTPPE